MHRGDVASLRCDRAFGFPGRRRSFVSNEGSRRGSFMADLLADRFLSPCLANSMADLRFYDQPHILVIIDVQSLSRSTAQVPALAHGG